MSLIKCPECGQQVSSKAPHCPHCGVPIEHNVKRCPVCNSFVLMSAEECPQCNAKFARQTPPTMPGNPMPPSPPATNEPGNRQPQVALAGVPANGMKDGQPEAKRQHRSHTPWYLLVLLILAIAIGGFFYWENQNQQATEEAAYLLLVDCKDPLNFEDFIAQFPNSKHIDEVRTRLKELQMAKNEWDAAVAAGDVQRLRDFIQAHPDSPFRKQALTRIDSLDWLEAMAKGSSAGYQYYIDQHETGIHIDEAYTARDEALKREEQARVDSVAAAQARSALADSLAAAPAATGIDVLTE